MHVEPRIRAKRANDSAWIVPLIGTHLVSELARLSRANGIRSLTVTTTNDNPDALRFYQRRGFRLAGLRLGAVDRARAAKPTIPWRGAHGVRLRDEIDFVRELQPSQNLPSRRNDDTNDR